jgi:Flp pilus assembly protein TadB
MHDVPRALVVLVLWLALAGVLLWWRRVSLRERGRARLEEPDRPDPAGRPEPRRARPFVRRHPLLPWLAAVGVVAALYAVARLPLLLAGTMGLMVGLLAGEVEAVRVRRATFRISEQLAEAIDLMVASLRVGAGALSALENAAEASSAPLRPQLEEMLHRIRYGADAQAVLHDLEVRVPLEPFRLFTSALAVHWKTGGSLAPTLATVSRVIRDRIEVNRRIRSLTTHARTSALSVLLLTYFLGLVMWRNDPERMQHFLRTAVGRGALAGALLFQAVGIVWSARMSRMHY